ncbi:EF-hand calcium-binding domain-containing protein 10 [Neosynchiropus ocellatus]
MAAGKEEDAAEYLKKHKILELMETLVKMTITNRPENPQEFLINQLEHLRLAQESVTRSPILFSDSNFDAVFGILDPAKQNYITFAQYKLALMVLGLKEINEFPDGVNEDKISFETFRIEV